MLAGYVVPKSDIPIGSEFGANQVNLATVLELVKTHEGDSAAFDGAIQATYGWGTKTSKNTRLSLGKYGLIDEGLKLTAAGERLHAMRAKPEAMHEEFARHILFNLNGMEVVRAIDAMKGRGEKPTQVTVARLLGTLGVNASASSTHLSKMISWLQRAGIFKMRGSKVDYESLNLQRVEQLIGATSADVDALGEMSEPERAVLRVLASLPMPSIPDVEPIESNHLRETAEARYGIEYDPKSFPGDILKPLTAAGYITTGKALHSSGREQITGKPMQVFRTEKFANEYLPPLIDALSNTGLPVLTLLRKPLGEVLSELKNDDKNIKGKALEALAFHLMRLLGLQFHSWRKRHKQTQGFEIDLVVEDVRLTFSRWQVQCKNTPGDAVRVEEVAKEVGLAIISRASVILVVTTGRFGRDAKQYADDVMKFTPLQVILLDGKDLEELVAEPLKATKKLNEIARLAGQAKAF